MPSTRVDNAMVLRDLTKMYGDFTAVKDLSLEVHKGEIFGLLGPNGSGKSTTIRTCLGLMSRTSGEVRILGLDSHKDSIEIRRRTGYLPGDFGLVPGVKTHSLLKYLLRLSNVSSEKKMFDMAERLDLDLQKKTNELSKGNRQKVGIVQAFMADQEFVILDEPTGGLDPLVQQVFYDILREEQNAGKTVFMSSHVLAEVEAVCNRVAIIREGKLVLLDSIKHLKKITGKVLDVTFRDPVDKERFQLPGVSEIAVDGEHVTMTVTENIDGIIKRVAEHGIVNMTLDTYSLDQLFMRYYASNGSDDDKNQHLKDNVDNGDDETEDADKIREVSV